MEQVTIVVFKIGEEEYGLDIAQVQSIERMTQMTRIPNAPEFVKGVINLRGNVMPIIDLRNKLAKEMTAYTDETRIIIANYDEIELGLIVDGTSDVINIHPEQIESTYSGQLDADFFGGILQYEGRLIIMLKLKSLMENDLQSGKEHKG